MESVAVWNDLLWTVTMWQCSELLSWVSFSINLISCFLCEWGEAGPRGSLKKGRESGLYPQRCYWLRGFIHTKRFITVGNIEYKTHMCLCVWRRMFFSCACMWATVFFFFYCCTVEPISLSMKPTPRCLSVKNTTVVGTLCPYGGRHPQSEMVFKVKI